MSLFLISNNWRCIEKACKAWQDLGFPTQNYDVADGVYVAFSHGHKATPVFFDRSESNCFFSVGTYFTEDTFDAASILSEKNLYNIRSDVYKEIFGHYVFFISSVNDIRVIPDPVGLINVYHATVAGDFCIGNDLLTVAGVMGQCELSSCGAQQFFLNENTVGTETVFSGVKRLGLGNQLCIVDGLIQERSFHNLTPEVINFDEYVKRVSSYFKSLGNYGGTVAAEASAGFDTRLVAACANSSISNLLLITNQNQSDRGVDEAVSKILAKKLGLQLVVVQRPDKISLKNDHLLHLFSVGRDVVRSAAWLDISSEKYKSATLILGGYGGEAIRAKYCKYGSAEVFAYEFYKAAKIAAADQRSWFVGEILKQIKIAGLDAVGVGAKDVCNRIYALDRMRVWGGAATTAMMIYGDRLHPFMDWHLLSPLLSFSPESVQEEKLQEKLVEYFSPGLMDLAVNPASTFVIDGDGRLKNKVLSRVLWLIYRIESKLVQFSAMCAEKFSFRKFGRDLTSGVSARVAGVVGVGLDMKLEREALTRMHTLESAWRRVERISSDSY